MLIIITYSIGDNLTGKSRMFDEMNDGIMHFCVLYCRRTGLLYETVSLDLGGGGN